MSGLAMKCTDLICGLTEFFYRSLYRCPFPEINDTPENAPALNKITYLDF